MQDEVFPTPDGLLRCLEALADEAMCLTLHRTALAIRDAVEIGKRESTLPCAKAHLQQAVGPIH